MILITFYLFNWTEARNAEPGTCDPDTEEYNSCGVLPSCEITCEHRNTRACAKVSRYKDFEDIVNVELIIESIIYIFIIKF